MFGKSFLCTELGAVVLTIGQLNEFRKFIGLKRK